jgi:hypothetical protein
VNNSPYILKPASVQSVMLRVLLALLPGHRRLCLVLRRRRPGADCLASVTALPPKRDAGLRGKPVMQFLTTARPWSRPG